MSEAPSEPRVESVIIQNVSLTFKVLKYFGFAAFTVEDKKIVTKPRDLFFLFLSLLTGIVFIIVSIRHRNRLGHQINNIADNANFTTSIASLILALTSMVLSFLFRHKTWHNVIGMAAFDGLFEEVDFFFDYTFTANRIRIFAFSLVFCSIPLNVIVYYIEESLLKAFLYWYSGTYFILSFSSLIAMLNGSYIRFKMINMLFELHLQSPSKLVDPMKKKFSNTKIISVGIEAYNIMMDIYESMNVCNGIQAFLGIGLLYFYSIFTGFMMFKDWSGNGCMSSITIASVINGCYMHLFTSYFIYVCHIVEEEPKKTLKLVNFFMSRSRNQIEISLLTSFGTLIKRRSPKFSCGLFDFDWALVYSVIASTSTNFIILMQFDLAAQKVAKSN